MEQESERLWCYILKSQWLRLKEFLEASRELSTLYTSGVDNESYQFKGRFIEFQLLSKEDIISLEELHKLTCHYSPNLAPLIHVTPSECLAVGIRIKAVFSQTPGPGAGVLVSERSHD